MSKKTLFSSSILILLLFLFGALTFNHKQVEKVQAQTSTLTPGIHTLSDYAWSAVKDDNGVMSGVGWIHFNPAHGGVTLNVPPSGYIATLNGYAWANPQDQLFDSDPDTFTNNIGWLSFNDSNCGPRAQLNLADGNLSGWAKFIKADGNHSNSSDDNWDGCVHLSGSNYSSQIDILSPAPSFTTDSFFWGGPSVVGWIHLCDSAHNPPLYCVKVDTVLCESPPPVAPTSIRATAGSQCGEIDLSWTASENPTGGFYLYRDGNLIQSFAPTDRSWTNSDVPPGTHTYQISSFNACLTESNKISSSPAAAACTSQPLSIDQFKCSPVTVAKNTASTLEWSISSSVPANCTITQPSGSDQTYPYLFTTQSSTGSRTTMQLQRSLLYNLTCTEGNTTVSKNAICYVAGDYQHF